MGPHPVAGGGWGHILRCTIREIRNFKSLLEKRVFAFSSYFFLPYIHKHEETAVPVVVGRERNPFAQPLHHPPLGRILVIIVFVRNRHFYPGINQKTAEQQINKRDRVIEDL